MESAQIQALYEPPPAAMPQLSEKPRHGFETRKTAGKPGSNSCNFTVALGLRATVVENGVRETYSARYYNPLTGRFMSRDPEDGKLLDPATLHKYLYAGGDPMNLIDPTGRSNLFASVAALQLDAKASAANLAITRAWVTGSFCTLSAIFSTISTNPWNGHGDIMPWGWTAACTAYAIAQGIQGYIALMAL